MLRTIEMPNVFIYVVVGTSILHIRQVHGFTLASIVLVPDSSKLHLNFHVNI